MQLVYLCQLFLLLYFILGLELEVLGTQYIGSVFTMDMALVEIKQ
jgi:hypothetical protein